MNAPSQQAGVQTLVRSLLFVLIRAVSHAGRLTVPKQCVVLTCDPERTNEAYRDMPDVTVTSTNRATFDLVLGHFHGRRMQTSDEQLILREELLRRPWFDIQVEVWGHQMMLRVKEVHDISRMAS